MTKKKEKEKPHDKYVKMTMWKIQRTFSKETSKAITLHELKIMTEYLEQLVGFVVKAEKELKQ